jgi:PAS domain S-box-containing protein
MHNELYSNQYQPTELNSFPEVISENDRLLEFIINSSKSSVTLINQDFKYVTANSAFCDLVKRPLEKIKGLGVRELWGTKNFNNIIKKKLERAFEGETVHYEDWFKIRSEEKKCFSIEYHPYANSDGIITHVVVISEDITEKKHMENVSEKVFEISDSAQSANNLYQLYASIHKITSDLMPADNFYISIYDKKSNLLTFPYFVDEFEESPDPEPLGSGLTEYVLLNKKAMLVTPEVFIKLVQKGEVEDVGAPGIDWLGVPLIIKDRAFGVIVVQSYSDGVRYNEEHKKILEFISSQVAMAIERKKYEDELKESSKKFAKIIQSIPIGLQVYQLDSDKQLILTDSNPAADVLLGIENEKFIGKTIKEALTPLANTDFQKICSRVALKGGVWKSDQINYENGKVRDAFEVHAFQFSPGKVVALFLDITKRKLTEEAIKLNEERFRNLYENSTMGLYTSTPGGRVLMANNALVGMLGYNSFEELKNVDLTKSGYVDPNSRKLFKEKVAEKGQIYGFEAEWEKANGERIFLRESARVLRDENGDPKYYEGTVEDITEKKKIEREIIKAKEKAEKLEQIKTYFLAQMSHEIRTPLNSLQNFYYLIREELSEHINDDLENNFRVITSESKRIARTIDLILNMSDLRSGSYKFKQVKFDLHSQLLVNVAKEFKQSYELKGLKFEISLETNNTIIEADEYSVEQILTQLIDNAIKYTYNGKITIKLLRDSSKKLVLEVIDTGIGISSEYLDNIFSLFSQEDVGYTRKFDGNGLGLALVKEYCKLNNAKIEVESEKKKGSTFRVIFAEPKTY